MKLLPTRVRAVHALFLLGALVLVLIGYVTNVVIQRHYVVSLILNDKNIIITFWQKLHDLHRQSGQGSKCLFLSYIASLAILFQSFQRQQKA